MIPAAPASTAWHELVWRHEPAWSSILGGVRAVVTEVRQRLIYLGPEDGSLNLLNAPYPRRLPDAADAWPNQGGHRFWLGPQDRWTWPPPSDWEFAAARRVEACGDVLLLQQPQADRRYPAIAREYAWEGARLRCTARWHDPDGAFYGMHIVPVDLPFTAAARLRPSPEVPLGLAEVRLDGTRVQGFLPHPAVQLDTTVARLTSGRQVFKAGFAPQTLTVARAGGWKLAVSPGPVEGTPVSAPDHGYLSQIWVGSPEHDLAELEQLTPYLRGGAQTRCASSIFIEAVRPAP